MIRTDLATSKAVLISLKEISSTEPIPERYDMVILDVRCIGASHSRSSAFAQIGATRSRTQERMADPMRIRLGAVESRRRDIVHTGKEHVNGSIYQRFARHGDPEGIGVSRHVNKFDHAPI